MEEPAKAFCVPVGAAVETKGSIDHSEAKVQAGPYGTMAEFIGIGENERIRH